MTKTIEHLLIEKLLDKFAMLIIVKANNGYSIIFGSREDYRPFLLRPHYNGKDSAEALEIAYKETK